MQRIVVRHLTGSKSNQVEEFPLAHFKEVIIGRDPSCSVKYDADRDDLVGRKHARIAPDSSDPSQFVISDLGSRNGTFVNRQRIVGMARIAPGDVVQFGAGGPEFQFDLEPRPQIAPRSTSEAGSPSPVPPTRTAASAIPSTRYGDATQNSFAPMTAPAYPHPGVGKATVERLIAETRSDSRKKMIIIGAAILGVVAVVAAFLIYHSISTRNQIESDLASAAPMPPSLIAKNNMNSVVYIEAGWDFIHTPSGGKVYHEYMLNLNPVTKQPFIPGLRQRYVPVYIQSSNGTIEPSLTTNPKTTYDGNGNNQPIGGTHTASGFVVGSEGFIITNRHVAAAWTSSYDLSDAVPGLIFKLTDENGTTSLSDSRQGNNTGLTGWPIGILREINSNSSLKRWTPSESKAFGRKPIKGKLLEGRNVYLEVTFAKTELPYKATLVRPSNRHDVALIKIDTPQSVAAIQLNDNYDQIQPGDTVTIMGYPAVSGDVLVSTKSQDPFNRAQQYKVVPDPTVTGGLVGKLLRDEQAASHHEERDYYSEFGDSIQLTANSIGAGSSGGPVFDDHGRVIGIFYAKRRSNEGAIVTFAVPIRYGMELMRTSPVMK